jgi:hypothetical protein
MHRLAVLALLLLGACASPTDPAAKAALDAWNARVSESSASYPDQAGERLPIAVGQWVEYRDVDAEGEPSRRRQMVVGEENGAYWLELEHQSYAGTSVVRTLLAADNWSQPSNIDVRRVVLQTVGEPAREMPVLITQLAVKPILASLQVQSWEGPIEAVTVPAGTFEARKISSHYEGLFTSAEADAWINGHVPLTGMVEIHGEDGSRSELVGFGTSGARSAIIGPVGSLLP